MQENCRSASQSAWKKLFQVCSFVAGIGSLIGMCAFVRYGREFTMEELGVFAWPLSLGYLVSFLYILSYLVFTNFNGRLRYVVIPLWALAVALLSLGLISILLEMGR